MPGTSIRLDGDVSALLQKMRSYSEIDRKGLNAALAESARESTLERFRQSRDQEGKKWKTSIRAATTGGRTLIDSAQLRNSIKSYCWTAHCRMNKQKIILAGKAAQKRHKRKYSTLRKKEQQINSVHRISATLDKNLRQ